MKQRWTWLVAGAAAVVVLAQVSAQKPVAPTPVEKPALSGGLAMGLSSLSQLSHAKTRSISPENFTGEKGRGGMATEGTGANAARDLGRGWKVSPSVRIKPGETFVMADIQGQGAIQHIWMTPTGNWRYSILRMLVGRRGRALRRGPRRRLLRRRLGRIRADFVPADLRESRQRVQLLLGDALPQVGPDHHAEPRRQGDGALLPDRLHAHRRSRQTPAYFHAQFRRVNPLPYKTDYTILDGVKGLGHYVGTYLAWGVNNSGWWGEGEIKFFLDGDGDFPTICGTGTEDYFCGSYNFENQETHQYQEFTTPYAGLAQVLRPDGLYRSQQRFGMYRWHIMDPVRFEQRPPRHDPGPGVARRRALPAAAGRHRLGGVLVPGGAARRVPDAPRPRCSRGAMITTEPGSSVGSGQWAVVSGSRVICCPLATGHWPLDGDRLPVRAAGGLL